MTQQDADEAAFSGAPAQGRAVEPSGRAFVVDSHEVVRAALCWFLLKAWPDFAILDIDKPADLPVRLHRTRPSIILLNGELLTGSAQEATAGWATPSCPAVLFVLVDDEAVFPGLSSPGLASATLLSRSLSIADLVDRINQKLSVVGAGARRVAAASGVVRKKSLTRTESKVLAAAGTGLLNKQIAYKMGITEATVKAHMSSVLRKLDVPNRVHAINVVRQENPGVFAI